MSQTDSNPSFTYQQQSQQGSNSTPDPSRSQPGPSSPQQTRQAAEQARKDRTLAEFMLMLDDYEPLVYSLYIYIT